MAREVQIDYPLEYDGDSVNETTVLTTFVAWGTCSGAPDDISAELAPCGGGAAIKGDLLIWPAPRWSALFEGILNVAGTDQFQVRPHWGAIFGAVLPRVPPGKYTLIVRRKKTDRKLAHRLINVNGSRGPGISYPQQSDCPLPRTFTAWGTTNNPPVTGATMQQQPNGPVIPGSVSMPLGGGGTWAAKFTVPAGNNYTLTVTDGSGSTSVQGLSVE